MTVDEYTIKFVKLSCFVTSLAMDEVARTRRFEKNLDPKVKATMSRIPSTSFQQAYDRALSIYDSILAIESEDHMKLRFVKRPYVAPTSSQYIQKKPRVNARPPTNRVLGTFQKSMSCYRCQKAYHPGNSYDGTPLSCFICKSPNHRAASCPQRPKGILNTGQVFVMSRVDAEGNPDMVTCAFLVHSLSGFVLFDTGASMSFVSDSFSD
ncbi:hypothetical protein vseg_011668 [Gypsophila vaccaria]